MAHCARWTSILALLLAALPASAETPVSGTITTQTWTKAESPYVITDTLVVPEGEMLTVEPSVEVVFEDTAGALIHGALFVLGTETGVVRITGGTGIVISGADSVSMNALSTSRCSAGSSCPGWR